MACDVSIAQHPLIKTNNEVAFPCTTCTDVAVCVHACTDMEREREREREERERETEGEGEETKYKAKKHTWSIFFVLIFAQDW